MKQNEVLTGCQGGKQHHSQKDDTRRRAINQEEKERGIHMGRAKAKQMTVEHW